MTHLGRCTSTAATSERTADAIASTRERNQTAVVADATRDAAPSGAYCSAVAETLARKAAVCERLMCCAALLAWFVRMSSHLLLLQRAADLVEDQ